MTQKTKKKVQDKLFTAVQVSGLCGINSHLHFAVTKKFSNTEMKGLFEWASIFIAHHILEQIPKTFSSLLSSQQVKDLSDLLK